MHLYPLRLPPNKDLRFELENLINKEKWSAAWIVTCVGSLQMVTLRLAGAKKTLQFEGPFEIISLVGTLSLDGVHLHISLSDKNGDVIGGHLSRGSFIYTTAEVVIGYSPNHLFNRILDERSGYEELVVTNKENKRK